MRPEWLPHDGYQSVLQELAVRYPHFGQRARRDVRDRVLLEAWGQGGAVWNPHRRRFWDPARDFQNNYGVCPRWFGVLNLIDRFVERPPILLDFLHDAEKQYPNQLYSLEGVKFILYYYLKAPASPARSPTSPTRLSRLNAIRFALARGWFKNGHETEDWLAGPPPRWTASCWQEKPGKFDLRNNSRPVALLHGKFMPFPHQQHEETIKRFKEKAERENQDKVWLVGAVDKLLWSPYDDIVDFWTPNLALSLMALIPEIDAVCFSLSRLTDAKNPDRFYKNFYREQRVKYLSVEDDMEFNPWSAAQKERAKNLGIVVVTHRWSKKARINQSIMMGKALPWVDIEKEMEDLEIRLSAEIWPDNPTRGLRY